MLDSLIKKIPRKRSIVPPDLAVNLRLIIDMTPDEQVSLDTLLNEISKTKKIEHLRNLYKSFNLPKPMVKEELKEEDVKEEEIKNIEEKVKSKIVESIEDIDYISNHKFDVSIPPILLSDPAEVVSNVLDSSTKLMSNQKIKKKMIEYTKCLFREKDPNKRAELRAKIKSLKNLLATPKDKLLDPFELLFRNQNSEVENVKKHLLDEYYDKLREALESYIFALSKAQNKKKVELFNVFRSDLLKLKDSFSKIVDKYAELLKETHLEELDSLKKAVKITPKLRVKLDNRKKEINLYGNLFKDLKDYVNTEILNIIRCRERQVVGKDNSEKLKKMFEILVMPKEDVIKRISLINKKLYDNLISGKMSKERFLVLAKKEIAKNEGIGDIWYDK